MKSNRQITAIILLIFTFMGQIGSIDFRTVNIVPVSQYKENQLDRISNLRTSNYKLVIPSVPYHYQIINYYCGPASLEMVFDFYGEGISQPEIADVARTYRSYGTYTYDLRRASQFSILSTSKGNELVESITGYTNRSIGYGTLEESLPNVDSLVELVADGYPIIVLQWFDTSHTTGHFRVVIGYVESNGKITQIITQDPWYSNGPNFYIDYDTFIDLWMYSGNWALFVSPWTLNVTCLNCDVLNSSFNVNAEINYLCPSSFTPLYPASSCRATINLPSDYSLAAGEINTKNLNPVNLTAGSVGTVSWEVDGNNTKSLDQILVNASGIISGSVPTDLAGLFNYPAYNYTDLIGGSGKLRLKSGGNLEGPNIIIPITITLISAAIISIVAIFIIRRVRRRKKFRSI
jgi:hypothetical protein